MAETKHYDVETSLTLDYRKKAWGLERIVLDSISNHLPADSQGTKAEIKFKQEGQYVDFRQHDPRKPVEEIIMEDDGKGYDAGMLTVLFSTKGADALSVGQFGEGLKLVAAACLRKGLEVEFHSRNWIAVPYAKREIIDGHEVQRLCFHITENGYNLQGSRTVFKNPHHPVRADSDSYTVNDSKPILEEVLAIPEKVLPFNSNVRVLYVSGESAIDVASRKYMPDLERYLESLPQIFEQLEPLPQTVRSVPKKKDLFYRDRIIDLGEGKSKGIFVKGVLIPYAPGGREASFSYDLGIEEINADRAYANQEIILNRIEMLLKSCHNEEVIETILRKAKMDRDAYCLEFEAFNPGRNDHLWGHTNPKASGIESITKIYKATRAELGKVLPNITEFKTEPNPWTTVFQQLYGEKAVLAAEMENTLNTDAELLGFKPIRLNRHITHYLSSLGVRSARDVAIGTKEFKWVERQNLTAEEQETLRTLESYTTPILGRDEPVNLRIYEGMYLMPQGREIESEPGVTYFENNEPRWVGIKRVHLHDPLRELLTTYVHELGHWETRKGDHTRQHAHFGFQLAADLLIKSREQK